ncbi:MAG: zeta toxin family protein, partial [Xanthomonadaceae bacterium]|nr:zeta toxin family protein [Xanthomonadaceae bacterium]
MTDFDSRIDPKEHDSVFLEILEKSGLDELVTHDKPKAIILAGQPGAGKGNLVDSAIVEHQGDILPVDPDELRDYHPEVKRLRG